MPASRGSCGPQATPGHVSEVRSGKAVPHTYRGQARLETAGPGAGTRRTGKAGQAVWREWRPWEEGSGWPSLTPAGWHSSARHPKGSFVEGCLAQPVREHTGPVLTQAGRGEVSRRKGQREPPEEGQELLSPPTHCLCPKGFPEFCSHAQLPRRAQEAG